MFTVRRVGRSRRDVLRPICQNFPGPVSAAEAATAAAATKPHFILDVQSSKVRTACTVDLSVATTQENKVVPIVPWTVFHRPILETILQSYALNPTVAQPLILHGPRGAGKRTVVENMVGKWNTCPHICAYVSFYGTEGAVPPWTMIGRFGGYHESVGEACLKAKVEGLGFSTLKIVRNQLEQGLESLTRKAIEMGYVETENVLDALLKHHTIDGALSQHLRDNSNASTSLNAVVSETTEETWRESVQLMKQIGKVSFEVDANTVQHSNASPNQGQLRPRNKHRLYVSKAQSSEEAFLSMALAKNILKIQEVWRVPVSSIPKGQGSVTRALADAATSWSVVLLQVLSVAAQEGHFQPKLVINNLDLMRKADAEVPAGSLQGSLYHDSLLMQITKMGVNGGCIPIIFVSSDSYYSCKVVEDHGYEAAFIFQEVLGWTTKETAAHLAPNLFEESEWKVITGILGPTPRHLAEVYSIWNNPFFLEVAQETNENGMGDCADLYLGYLQVTTVDPAMEVAIKILEKFAEDCIAGKISKTFLRLGVAWRHPPSAPSKHHQWAKIQLLDYIQAIAKTDFAANHGDVRAQELLEDPATQALLEVGLLYQQKDIPYLRPISRGVSRCFVRWHVRERLQWNLGEKVKYAWHCLARGRFFKQLTLV